MPSRRDNRFSFAIYMQEVERKTLEWKGRTPTTPEELVEANLRLVPYTMKRFPMRPRVAQEDILCAGNEGLWHAARTYDPSRISPRTGLPVRFSTYACLAIRQAIFDYLLSTPYGAISTPKHTMEPSTAADPARRMSENRRMLQSRHIRKGQISTSLRGKRKDQIQLNIPDHRAESPDEAAERAFKVKAVRESLWLLDEKRRTILQGRMDGASPLDLGNMLGITRERVRQLEADAMVRLSKIMIRRFPCYAKALPESA